MQLIYYPHYSNPYQRLLYRAFPGNWKISAGKIEEALDILENRSERLLFHLHWEDALFKNEDSEERALARAKSFLYDLLGLQSLGGKLAWTIHNYRNHEGLYPGVENFLRQRLARSCDLAFVHSQYGREKICARWPALAEKVLVTPHGNYAGVYPGSLTRSAARAELGYAETDRVFLVFGDIRKHKRLDLILQAHSLCRANRGPWQLLIAGQVYPGVELNLPGSGNQDQVRFLPGRVPDAEVQKLFAAADFAVFASEGNLTSGSMMLALTMGVPVIAPAVGDAVELIEEGKTGFLIREQSPEALAEGLRRAAVLAPEKRKEMALCALKQAESLSWAKNAMIIEKEFLRLLLEKKQ